MRLEKIYELLDKKMDECDCDEGFCPVCRILQQLKADIHNLANRGDAGE